MSLLRNLSASVFQCKFCLQRNTITRSEISRIIAAVCSMTALKHLTLKLDDTRADDQHIKDLFVGLHQFDFLKSLNLSLGGNPLTLPSVSSLLISVSKLPRLTKLHVSLRRIASLLTNKSTIDSIVSSLRVADVSVSL